MDYETVQVVRDTERQLSYFTLHDGRHLCVTDGGKVEEVSSIPQPGPEKEQCSRFFVVKDWPRSTLNAPSYQAERMMELLLAQTRHSYDRALEKGVRQGMLIGLARGRKHGISVGKMTAIKSSEEDGKPLLRLASSKQ